MALYDGLYDLAITPEGDLIVDDDGDLAVATEAACLRDEVLMRAKTLIGDLRMAPDFGSSLEELLGEPNSPATGREAKQRLIHALTKDLFVLPHEINVQVLPLHNTQYHILRLGSPTDFVQLVLQLDLDSGLKLVES